MAQPVTLYPAKGKGEPLICAAPSEVKRLLATGEWLLEPAPETEPEKPKTTTRSKKADEG